MRTVLYANAKISQTLRKNFVLHWKSVRPVPRITIDFGDGRVMERTITGNAVHYVLDTKGQLIDAIPGIYGAKAFSRILQASHRVFQQLNHAGSQRQTVLVNYHSKRLQNIYQNWKQDLGKIKRSAKFSKTEKNMILPVANKNALRAIRRAYGKGTIELPVLRLVFPNTKPLLREMNEENWKQLAKLHIQDARLDANSQRLISYQNPKAALASLLTVSKAIVENPILRMIRTFENSLAVDTIRNEYEFHSRIHLWFCQGAWQQSLEALNKRVYAEIFLTPMTDPWLGLKSNLYTGLENNGLLK